MREREKKDNTGESLTVSAVVALGGRTLPEPLADFKWASGMLKLHPWIQILPFPWRSLPIW